MRKKCFWKVVLALALTLPCMAACTKSYSADIGPQALCEAAMAVLQGKAGEYYMADEDTYPLYFGKSEAYADVQDCAMIYHGDSTNVNRVGVFRVSAGGDVHAVRDMVQDYLEGELSCLRGFAANYQPDAMAKLDCARVQALGRYVVFTILDAEDATAVYRMIRERISQSQSQ